MKNVHNGLGAKTFLIQFFKKIYGIYKTKDLTNKQIRKYKMTEKENFEKYANLNEDELREKSNKNVYVKNAEVKKKRGERTIDGFRKKLMILDSEITEYPEHEVKSKIGNIFVNEKILGEYSVKIYEIDPYFQEHFRKKIQVDENGCKYVLFRIDIYFIEYLLAVEIDEKDYTDGDLIFEEKRQKALEKKLDFKFIRINTSKEGYDADYASRIQTFTCKFKDRQLKKLIKK